MTDRLPSITKVDEIHELDGGGLMGWHLHGEPDIAEVELFLADMAYEYGDDEGIFEDAAENDWDVVPTYVRQVPYRDECGHWGQMKYVYQSTPGPGASRIVRVEPFSQWNRWCANHIYERARAGHPVENVKDAPWPKVIDGYVHLCAVCSASFHARTDLARAHALIEMYDEQGTEASARYAADQRARLDQLTARVAETTAARETLDAAA